MDAGNWITLLLGLGTLGLGAGNLYAQWPRRTEKETSAKSIRPTLFMIVLTVIVVGSVGYDIYDRRNQVHRESVVSWGAAGDNYHMAVVTQGLEEFAKTHRMMLILRPSLMGIDPATDTNIAKSTLYTISGSVVVLAVPAATPLKMVPNQLNFMDFNAVLLPIGIGPERIRSLADVTDLGGKVYQTRATSVMAGPPVDQPVATQQSK
jgi:hypothetical protein